MSPTRFGEDHLAYPDLFPARRGGEPWGDRELTVLLPGGPYRFTGLDSVQKDVIRRRLHGLTVEAGRAPSVECQVFRAARSDFRDIDPRGWEYSLSFDHEPKSVRVAGLELMGRLDWTPELKGALWSSAACGETFYGAFENFFRVLFSYRLLECGGALIHSAGVVDAGGAYLFPGRSGAGKSTLSRLSVLTGRELLSDDLNALCPRDGEPRAARLPFTGDFKFESFGSESYPLRAIYRLEKGETNALKPMSAACCLGALFSCSPNVNVDPYRRDVLISNLETFCRSVPSFTLTFTLAGGVWDVLRPSGV